MGSLNRWKFFIPVAVAASAGLLLAGVPLFPIVVGILLGGFFTWAADRRARRGSR
jgi:hypothetical protein